MAARRYTLAVENNTIGSLNQALVGFTLDNAKTDAQNAAACILYLASASAQAMGAGCSIRSASSRAVGAAGSAPIPFPEAEYAALQAELAGPNVSAVPMTEYGVAIGGGALAPLGTSVCVSEISSTVGRAGRGRHFLPYVTASAIDTAGLFLVANANAVGDSYRAILIDGLFVPVVCPENLTAPKPVVLIQARRILSNLRSRRK